MKTRIKKICLSVFLSLLSVFVSAAVPGEQAAGSVFKPEELEQMLAPIALYPDSLLSQLLMASTYPLEVVQAQRWIQQNSVLAGDALTAELEKQAWDPSVKSLVAFPQVLAMMDEKLEWTQKLGDAFLAQQKEVMGTVQKLRKKAQQTDNLKATGQLVTVQEDTIIIEYANPEIVYVPTYDPNVVYGAWPYPAYPPYYYYPPGYYPGAPYVAFTCGVAWGYAWGHCDWDDCDIDIDVDHNYDFNNKIDRDKYVEHYNNSGRFENRKGKWQHNPENRRGVAYRDLNTAQKFNRTSTSDAVKSREEFRGRAEQGRQDLASGIADKPKGWQDIAQRGNIQTADRVGTPNVGKDRVGQVRPPSSVGGINRPGTLNTVSPGHAARPSGGVSGRVGAFDGINQGSTARNYSSRGATSRQNISRPSGAGGGMGGAGRGGGARGGRR